MARSFVLPLLFSAVFLTGCNSYFYWPEARPPVPIHSTGVGIAVHRFPSQDGQRLEGWFIRAKTLETKGLVVYCHGTDTNVGEYFEAVEFLPYHGFDLFLFDYRGYGASEGKPSREGTIEDTHAAIDYAKSIPLVAKPVVALWGYSLGSGIAIVTAAERSDVLGVVAESGFESYRNIGRKVAGDRWSTWALQIFTPVFISRGKDAIDYVDKISPRPLFIVHGQQDELVPYTMAENLYAKAKEPKKLWIMKDFPHYSPPSNRHPEYERRFASYFDYIFAHAEGREPEVGPDCYPGDKIYD
jgi:fermentation-respiration switch protein FrsA (DUF1100 family)